MSRWRRSLRWEVRKPTQNANSCALRLPAPPGEARGGGPGPLQRERQGLTQGTTSLRKGLTLGFNLPLSCRQESSGWVPRARWAAPARVPLRARAASVKSRGRAERLGRAGKRRYQLGYC